nr:hypothetical protein BaRGS_028707 [Batillaria attramentaria]
MTSLQVTRQEQVILLRLRTGHNRLNAHMHRKLGLAPNAECSCGTGEQTAEHVPQQCPKLQELRTAVWPEETSLYSKLYGRRQELQKTAHFIVTTGLPV